MGIDINGLINYLRLEGPHNLERILTASKEDAPLPRDKLTDEEGDSKEEGDDPAEARPMEEVDPEKDPSEREPTEEEDSEEDPDEDPEEDPSEKEPMEKEDPEEDPTRGNQWSRRILRRTLRKIPR